MNTIPDLENLPKVRITRIGNMFKKPMSMVMDPSEIQEHPHIPLNTVYLGVVINLPNIGGRLICAYHAKDGVEIGYKPGNNLMTTPVTEINGDNYATQNSIYKVELL